MEELETKKCTKRKADRHVGTEQEGLLTVAKKKLPCSSKACASCPFRSDNHLEFGLVAKALSKKHKQPVPDFFQVLTIRKRITEEAVKAGFLLCHQSVYDSDMNASTTKAIQCSGLAEHVEAKANGQI